MLAAFDDERGLVINAVVFRDLLQVMVLHDCELQDRVTDLPCRLIFVFTDHLFNLPAVLFVTSVVDAIGVEKKQVPRAHEGDFCHVRRVDLPGPQRH